MKVYFYGSSDDLIEIESADGKLNDEIDAYNRSGWIKMRSKNGDGLMVFAHYAPNGCPDGTWVFGITLLNEDHPLPDWQISFKTNQNGYSPCLIVDAPDDVELILWRE